MQTPALGRVALCAMNNTFTRALAKRLFDEGHLALIVQPLPRSYRHEEIIFDAPPQENPNALSVEYRNKVPLRFVGDASQTNVCVTLQMLKIDTIIVSFFNQLLRKPVLSEVAQRVFNFHPSLLPKLRGPAPIFWTLKDKHKQTGMTLHQIDLGEDTGPIVYQTPPLLLDDESDVSSILKHAEAHIDEALHALRGEVDYTPQPEGNTRARRPNMRTCTFTAAHQARESLRVFHALKSAYRFYIEVDKKTYGIDDAEAVAEASLPQKTDHVFVEPHLFLRMKGGIVKFQVRQINACWL